MAGYARSPLLPSPRSPAPPPKASMHTYIHICEQKKQSDGASIGISPAATQPVAFADEKGRSIWSLINMVSGNRNGGSMAATRAMAMAMIAMVATTSMDAATTPPPVEKEDLEAECKSSVVSFAMCLPAVARMVVMNETTDLGGGWASPGSMCCKALSTSVNPTCFCSYLADARTYVGMLLPKQTEAQARLASVAFRLPALCGLTPRFVPTST